MCPAGDWVLIQLKSSLPKPGHFPCLAASVRLVSVPLSSTNCALWYQCEYILLLCRKSSKVKEEVTVYEQTQGYLGVNLVAPTQTIDIKVWGCHSSQLLMTIFGMKSDQQRPEGLLEEARPPTHITHSSQESNNHSQPDKLPNRGQAFFFFNCNNLLVGQFGNIQRL